MYRTEPMRAQKLPHFLHPFPLLVWFELATQYYTYPQVKPKKRDIAIGIERGVFNDNIINDDVVCFF